MPRLDKHEFMRRLGDEYDTLCQRHFACAPRNGDMPVGGGDWMDTFFRMEAIRGCLTALRNGKKLGAAVQEGKDVSSISVQIWNQKREYQVHRREETAWSYLDRLVVKIRRQMEHEITTA